MDPKHKEILEKQLEILSERSSKAVDITVLPELTKSMCMVIQVLANDGFGEDELLEEWIKSISQ